MIRSRRNRGYRLLGLVALSACDGHERRVGEPTSPVARVLRVAATNAAETVSAPGIVAFRHEVPLGFVGPGRIASVMVEEGDRVRAGQLLASLDAAPARAASDATVAERVRAEAAYRRVAALKADGWVTQAALDSAFAILRTAQTNERSDRFQLLHTQIHASGPAVVLARLAEPDQVAEAGRPVVVLGEERAGYVLRIALSDRRAASVVRGARARVMVDAFGRTGLGGRVVEVGAHADPATGLFQLEIAIPPDPRLRAGQVGFAEIAGAKRVDQQIGVPPSAIFAARAGTGFIHVVDPHSSRVAVRRIVLGEIARDDAIPVTGGLRSGEWIVASSTMPLADGDVIRPIIAR